MAQKALKTLAARNASTLNRTHLITLALHLIYHILRFLPITSHRSLLYYTLLTLPAIIIEIWFERIARPTYTPSGEVKRAGEDLEAKGLTEWMWDIVYWTWGCLGLVALVGDWAWWGWIVVPVYSAYLAVGTFLGVRKGFGGLMGGQSEGGDGGGEGEKSKRQGKMERRGGQRVAYR